MRRSTPEPTDPGLVGSPHPAASRAMTRYVALLRGVNVGGVTVRSADLAALFTELGFGAVKTVLASGNVLFDTDAADAASGSAGSGSAGSGSARAAASVKQTIELGLRDRFGYDVWIVLVEHAALAAIVDAFPYDEVDGMQPYVVFGSDAAVLRDVARFAAELDPATDGERAEPGDGVLYWEVPKGHSVDTALAKHLARPALKSSTTTRNLRTLRKLL
ncbi:DUF1697 domain-containing protein [Herbiconiux daphne]|uniref:DUF1697 domain-containing protein n=1 Tax=Herbiconiux daphne TaxID=2970914 RepID=A0ABT2GWD5_9MICO|nr:DUF1697 domain-containing protein [Herbiconiux daphne]MCS5732276.1 DUF1697 domain-containing protein [Herbiconiux daphne]